MNPVYSLLSHGVEAWVRQEKGNSQSLVNGLLKHIEARGNLRPPQKEAVQTYLWIKFEGGNRKLSQMIRDGLLHDEQTAREYQNYRNFGDNYVGHFLNQFCQDNGLTNLHRRLVNDPQGEETDWEKLLDELLHDFDYANYLFSLPMGAGKTFLMACFIYLDLHFSTLFQKQDERFAHNFVIFAPHAAKTAILPSLKTIRNFDPEWALPKADADRLRRVVSIEVLDSLSSKRRDKLHGNNPNLEKVNRLRQTSDFGMVFITNAEKVVLERYEDRARAHADSLKKRSQADLLDERKLEEIEKSNALREALSMVPNLTVILDEVHHAYGSTGNGEKKLRRAIGILNQHGNINTVIGLSGTPYVKSRIEVGGKAIRLNQIQDIVYHYPLNVGIGKFLKRPDIKDANIEEKAFVKQALSEFFKSYDKTYAGGAKSKAAFYCPSIKNLNEEILPVVQEWYAENRPGREEEIFRFYSKVDKQNKEYALPKDSLIAFNSLDRPHSKKRVILLVAVGAEGWDCRSLTSVVLPRQKTAKNFVLQTTCRCLREVDDAANERALVYLSRENYYTLDQELKDNYQLSISDLSKVEDSIQVQVRKPQLGKLNYKQVESRYRIVKKITPGVKEIKQLLRDFQFSTIKRKYRYEEGVVSSAIGRTGLVREGKTDYVEKETTPVFSFTDFLYDLAASSYGMLGPYDLEKQYGAELQEVHKQIAEELKWITLNPHIDLKDIVASIIAGFMSSVEYGREAIEQETEIELLEWEGSYNEMSCVSPNGAVYKFMPRLGRSDLKMYRKHPEDVEDLTRELDQQDISFNYIPYKMDSEFERNALAEMLKLAELEKFEIYFNGYKDERLQSFWVQTPRGRYTPDFLILKRKKGKRRKGQRIAIDKVLIIETKGKPYYDDDFKAKEQFIQSEFLQRNKHFRYHCFVDDDKNDFRVHLDKFKQLLDNF